MVDIQAASQGPKRDAISSRTFPTGNGPEFARAAHRVKDPVCDMDVDPHNTKH
jgi:hypothetical protein